MTNKDIIKDKIAKQINHKADIARIIAVNYELDLKEGEIYDNRGLAESWSDKDRSQQAFIPEIGGNIEYVFYANNVPCHLVDYSNIKETDSIGAADCETEGEVLIPSNAVFKIISEPYAADLEELGYYIVELEFIGFTDDVIVA